MLLAKYLAVKSRDDSFKYIAKHYFDNNSVRVDHLSGALYAF